MASANYEEVLSKLLASGWTPDQGVPEELIAASNADNPGSVGIGPGGSPGGPMQPGAMQVPGNAPIAQTSPGGGPMIGGAGTDVPSVWNEMNDEDAERYAGMGELRRQREQAEALRDTADAEGRTVNRGRTFVAASPLEHLVVGLKRRKGKKETGRIGKEQTKGRKSLIDLLRNRGKDDFSETEVGYEYEEDDSRYA